ncbi:LysR family transcriptional regulator [Stutzerimonas urumqiensis]|uniref:LysR family transcriptional regulator n=1 Tax=Stutzerimonas urumqiensis TaxID=638269 RepID=UPI003BAB3F14
MELRHLRYFVAVADEGNVTAAASNRLFTSQPSLSRQLKDLEQEVGAELFVRTARGVALTPAGVAFLEQARLALGYAAGAVEAARRAARLSREAFSVGFLTGQEVDWLPRVTQLLRDDLPNIEFRVVSLQSPSLADALQRGDVDLGFLRVEPRPNVRYEVIARESLLVVMPSDHRLAGGAQVDPHDIARETFIGYSDIPHVLRGVVSNYFADQGIEIEPSHYVLDDFGTGISLVSSTRGVTLLPAYVEPLMPRSVISRPLAGVQPTIDIALGYRSDNPSSVLAKVLANITQLVGPGLARARRR